MTPYYRDDFVTLYHGRCEEVAPLVGDYDHFIGDPPYDAKTHEGARSELRPNYKIDFEPIDPAFVVSLVRPKRWAVAFCALEMLGDYKRLTGERWIRSGVWDRTDGAPQISGDRPAQGAEGIAIWHPGGAKRWNGGGKQAKWRYGIVRGDDRVHDTQKPLGLMRDLVLEFTDAGELIVDYFAGSGTTGVAAKVCGRRAVLVEMAEAHCESAAKRLAATFVDERIAVGFKKGKQRAIDWGKDE